MFIATEDPAAFTLRKEKPSILISQLVQFNVIAIIAKFLAFIPLRILLVEHIAFNSLEVDFQDNIENKINLINYLRRFFYPKADVVAGN